MNPHIPDNNPRSPEFLAAHWMPFTGNRQFKADPRLIAGAEGNYYTAVWHHLRLDVRRER